MAGAGLSHTELSQSCATMNMDAEVLPRVLLPRLENTESTGNYHLTMVGRFKMVRILMGKP